MAYIGRQLVRGQNRVLDDISGSFNGSTTAFNLTVSSSSSPPASVNQLWIILGGILQKPGTDFTVADAVLTFTTAPASTLSFWGMIQGDTSDINSPADASVTPSKIANSGDFAFPADVRFKDADGSHYVGLQAPSTVSSNLVWTLPAADGSANQVLKTDGSGALGWASDANAPEGTAVLSTGETGTTKYLRVDGDNTCSWQLAVDETKMPLAGGIFTGDVTFDGATAGRDIVWDRSDNALEFADNAKLFFGGELSVYHDGNNFIKTSDGYLNIQVDGNNLYLDANETRMRSADGGEILAKFIDDGAVELYHNGLKRFETTADGCLLGDSRKLQFGAGPDLEIYSDATNAFIKCPDTGNNLTIESDQHLYIKVGDSEDAIKCVNGQAVELYYDNVKKVETQSYGIQLHDATAPEMRLLRTGNSGYSKIYTDAANKLYLCADHTAAAADTKVVIVSDGIERASWDSEYYVKNGSIVFEAADKGVCLGSTTLSAANTLTDYEEGTFTPSLQASTTNPSYGGTAAGTYVKIGQMVHCWGVIDTNPLNSDGSGNLMIGGLPFNNTSEVSSRSANQCCISLYGQNWGGDGYRIIGYVGGSESLLRLKQEQNNGGQSLWTWAESGWSAGNAIYFQACYRV